MAGRVLPKITYTLKYVPYTYRGPRKAYFHCGCALRCVAREIETLSASLHCISLATQRNAQLQWK